MDNEEALQALAKCLKDREWRLHHLYLILDEEKNMEPFVLRQEQESFLTNRHNRNIVPKARKLGMSTLIVIEYLDDCIWNPNRLNSHIDRTRDDAEAKLDIARFAWDKGPSHPNPGIAQIWKDLHQANPRIVDNGGEMSWHNGSSQQAAISLTGKTPLRLHISEYGPIAAQEPARAAEIKRGSINSVPINGIIDIETTMEGGPFGECYEIFSEALESANKPLSQVEWRMHFFPWFHHPSYKLEGRKPEQTKTIEYFAKLQEQHSLTIPLERQAWYELTWKTQRENMWSQFPSTPAECVQVATAGRIYDYMTTIRLNGRVREFDHERSYPIITGWDIGVSDYMSGWAVQFAAKEVNWLHWWEGEGCGAVDVVNVIRGWEALFGQKMALNLFPHDANHRDKGSAKTFTDTLRDAGLASTTLRVIPITSDVWMGINYVRDLLPKSWFHQRCDQPRVMPNGSKSPSGVACLENYRKKPDASSGTISEIPVHDRTSHTADAARTIGEAWGGGYLASFTKHAPEKGPEYWEIEPKRKKRGAIAEFRG